MTLLETPVKTTAAIRSDTQLARDLRLFDITMVGVGAMIGAGIFALTGIAAGIAGPGLILAFALNGLLTFCTAMVYAEVGSAIPGAGGGYLWTKFGMPGPSSFLVGWMDWLAHAVAGSLYAVVFGSYVVWGMQTLLGWGTAPTGAVQGEMGTLFGLNAKYFAKALTLCVCLLFIWINYRGSSETGKAGNIITVSKIITITIFIAFGLAALWHGAAGGATASHATVGEKFKPFLPMGESGVLVAMGLTFIAFEGYEIIVQAGEEVDHPRRNIPRAVFWSLAIVIPIYLLVAIVCIGAISIPQSLTTGPDAPYTASQTWAYLAALGETGVAEAANQFMPWGTGAILLVVGAMLSTMSALNATTYSSTRVSFAMGRDRMLPGIMAKISPATRTPVAALIASGILITTVALLLDAERVAAATCVMFLLVFAVVNASAIMIRRKYGDKLHYGYRTPFFPYLPIFAIVGQLAIAAFLLFHEPLSMAITLSWVSIGVVIYYAYSRGEHHDHKATPIVFEQRTAPIGQSGQILVPVANPTNAAALIELGGRLATARQSALVVLHVIGVPEQLPLYATGPFITSAREVVDDALALASRRGIPAEGLVRVAHHPARSIIDTIVERKCRAVVLGWTIPKEPRARFASAAGARRPLLGTKIDRVLLGSDADTIMLRGLLPEDSERIMIPIVNPRQGQFALEVAEAVAGPGTIIEFINVGPDEDSARSSAGKIMEQIFGDPNFQATSPRRSLRVVMQPVVGAAPLQAIVDRVQGADIVIVGAGSESWLRRQAFTPFHAQLAALHHGPMLLVKRKSGVALFASQRTVEFFASKEPDQ